jgi:hypothetical protein
MNHKRVRRGHEQHNQPHILMVYKVRTCHYRRQKEWLHLVVQSNDEQVIKSGPLHDTSAQKNNQITLPIPCGTI